MGLSLIYFHCSLINGLPQVHQPEKGVAEYTLSEINRNYVLSMHQYTSSVKHDSACVLHNYVDVYNYMIAYLYSLMYAKKIIWCVY